MSQVNFTYNREGYWLTENDIFKVEKRENAKYMGSWFLPEQKNNENSEPVDVFYTPSGNTRYIGFYMSGNSLFNCDAHDIFDEELDAFDTRYGVYVPVFPEEKIYLETLPTHKVKVIGGDFIVVGTSD